MSDPSAKGLAPTKSGTIAESLTSLKRSDTNEVWHHCRKSDPKNISEDYEIMRTCGALISVISDYRYNVLRNTLINTKHDKFSYLIKEVKVNSLYKVFLD